MGSCAVSRVRGGGSRWERWWTRGARDGFMGLVGFEGIDDRLVWRETCEAF
jgi:hypothetical protein